MSELQNQPEGGSLGFKNSDNQNNTGSVSPIAQYLYDELRKTGTRVWLGYPPPEIMAQLRAEKTERDFQQMRKRLEAHDKKMANLKARVREVIKRNRAGLE